MKSLNFSIVGLCFFIPFVTFSQTTVILQPGPEQGKDASIWTLEPTVNYGDFSDYIAATWTWSGDEGTYRSLLEFNLDTIPAGAEITCANLSLYYNDLSGTNGQEGENESTLQRITSPWLEDVVTWNTMPTTTSVDEVILPTSTFISEDYLDIDVTDLMIDMIADPVNSYGFMISLTTEETYSSMKFCSSDYSGAASNYPKLEICYNAPLSVYENLNQIAQIFPNPFNDYLTVDFQQPTDQSYNIMLYDLTGKLIVNQIAAPGTTQFNLNFSNQIAEGLYTIVISGVGVNTNYIVNRI